MCQKFKGVGGGVNERDSDVFGQYSELTCMRTIAVRPLTNWGTAPDCKRQYGVYVFTPRLYARAHTLTSMFKLWPQERLTISKC